MADAATRAALTAEKVRVTWDYETRQVEMHERRYLQLMAISLTAGLAVVAAVLVEKVPTSPGLLLSSLLFGAALYFQFLTRRLQDRLRIAWYATRRYIDSLMTAEDE